MWPLGLEVAAIILTCKEMEMKIIKLKFLKVSQQSQRVSLLIRFGISGLVFISQWDLSKSISIHKSPQITQYAHQSQHRYDLRSINCAII